MTDTTHPFFLAPQDEQDDFPQTVLRTLRHALVNKANCQDMLRMLIESCLEDVVDTLEQTEGLTLIQITQAEDLLGQFSSLQLPLLQRTMEDTGIEPGFRVAMVMASLWGMVSRAEEFIIDELTNMAADHTPDSKPPKDLA